MHVSKYSSLRCCRRVPQRDHDKADMPTKREAPEAPDNPEQALMDQVCTNALLFELMALYPSLACCLMSAACMLRYPSRFSSSH